MIAASVTAPPPTRVAAELTVVTAPPLRPASPPSRAGGAPDLAFASSRRRVASLRGALREAQEETRLAQVTKD